MAKKELWHPVDTYDDEDIRAIQALALYAQGAERPWPAGVEPPPPPTEQQVKRALDCIIEKLSQRYEDPAVAAFAAGEPNVVWYMAGRASVGKAITKLMALKVGAIARR